MTIPTSESPGKKCSGATKYWVYRAEQGGKYRRVKITTKTYYVDKTVKYNKKYSYKVKAVGKNGKTSSFSNIKSGLIKCDDFTFTDFFGVADFGFWFECDPYDVYYNDSGVVYSYSLADVTADGLSLVDAAELYSTWLDIYGFDFLEEYYSDEFDTYNYMYIRKYDNLSLLTALSEDGLMIFVVELE